MPVRFWSSPTFGNSRLLDWLVLGAAGSLPRRRVPLAPYGLPCRHSIRRSSASSRAGVTHWGTWPPKRGAAWLAVRAGVPLVPVA